MSAYNLVNGFYCAENAHLLSDILKQQWGFDGFVESDWFLGTRSTVGSAVAGLDIEMPSPIFYGNKLVLAVEDELLPVSHIDDSVRRILRKKFEFGLDQPKEVALDVVESPEHVALARQVAREAIVLLKNDDALPLVEATEVVVVGKLAKVANMGDEGSSAVHPSSSVSPLEGLSQRGSKVSHVDADVLSQAAAAQVAAAEAAVVVVGLTAADEGENIGDNGGDRDSLALSPEHEALIAAVAAQNDKTIVVVEGGSAITMPWIDAVEGVMMAWYPGMEGGHAIADVVYGQVNPSGRLPISFAADQSHLPAFDHSSNAVTYGFLHGYRHIDEKGHQPLFPFGFGLSYTTFSYDDLSLDSDRLVPEQSVTATVTVSNTGTRAGHEVVQLYVGIDQSKVVRAKRDLRAFARVELAAGESKSVQLTIAARDLAYFDVASDSWKLEAGSYRIEVGGSSRDLPLQASVLVE